MESMEEASMEDSLRSMQILRDNFTLWGIDIKLENRDVEIVEGEELAAVPSGHKN
jgi:hypothetical protein